MTKFYSWLKNKTTAPFLSFNKSNSGFTLMELLIVIVLIGVLSTIILLAVGNQGNRARDAQRKSNLKAIQNALQLYYSKYKQFPTHSASNEINGCSNGGNSTCTWGSAWVADGNTYMNPLPDDTAGPAQYRYTRDTVDTYTLAACLEDTTDTQCGADETWCACPFYVTFK